MLERAARSLSALSFVLAAPAAVAQGMAMGAAFPCPYAFGVGDVDGNGTDEFAAVVAGQAVVFTSFSGTTLAYLTRPGIGAFERYSPAGDVNADGHADLVWCASSGNAVVVSGADGSVLHTWPPSFFLYQEGLGGADFDADGHDDVVLRADQIFEIRSGRTGALLHSFTFFGGPLFVQVRLGDVDGDGYPDLSMGVPSIGQYRIVKGPSFATTTYTDGRPRPLGDVNNNGCVDRIAYNTNLAVAEIVDGAGAVIGTLPVDTSQTVNQVLDLGDVDGDGNDDFSVYTSLPPHLREIVSGATLGYLAGGTGMAPVRVGDFDGDGRVECTMGVGGTQTRVEWIDPSLPVASRMVARGASGTTSTGSKARVSTRGSCALGKNAFFDVRGTLPNGISLLIVGGALDVDLAPLGAPGNRLYANPDAVLLLLSDGNGVALQSFAMPVSPTLLGSGVSVQAATVDAAANPFGLVFSNAIDVVTNN